MSLTPQQQQFLKIYLQARPVTKDKLGGRQLAKIKGEFATFCKERQKLVALINELKRLPLGDELAAVHKAALDKVAERVLNGSTIGDETVFKPCYKELETIRKECQKDLDGRKKAIKGASEQAEKFKKELSKALEESKPDKKKQKLEALKQSIYTWLQDQHGPETSNVWPISERVMKELGGPGKDDLAIAARELETQVHTLGKEVAKAEDTGLDPITYNTAHAFDTKLHQLVANADKYIKFAESIGNTFYVKQFERIQDSANRLLWIVDPPPVPTMPLPPIPQGGGNRPGTTVVQNDEDVQEDKPLTDAEQADKSLLKSDGILTHFQDEYDRVKKNYETLIGQIDTLKTKTNSSQAFLETDLQMLDSAAADAKRALEAAENQLALANTAREEAEKVKNGGDWKSQVVAIGAAADTGLRSLAVAEKATGQIEGGLLYIERSFDSIQSLKKRVEDLDEALLDIVRAKIPLLPECNKTSATGDELEMLKQLVFVSAMEDQKITAALGKAIDRNSLDKVIKEFIEKPKHSTEQLTGMMNTCHMICVDADRYFGTQSAFANSLPGPEKAKFTKIQNLANTDIGKYTVPIIPRPKRAGTGKLASVGVAVIGGGPIGLMAAVEARMSGASMVNVYEGRDDPYSRLNVLKIGQPQVQRFRSAGVFDAIFPNGVEPNTDAKASVMTIENALDARCKSLGIVLDRGKFLKDVDRDEKGVVQLYFKGEEDRPKTCDLLIVATGASIAAAQKHADNVKLSDNLGIPFQKSSVKDYAAVGVFSKDAKSRDGGKEQTDGWAYDFETDQVKYIVTQLSEEEYRAYCDDPNALRDRIIQDAQKTKILDRTPENDPPLRASKGSTAETVEADGLDQEIDRAWTQLLQELGGTKFFGRDVENDQEKIRKAKKRAKASLVETLKKKRDEGKEEKVSPAAIENVVLTFLNMELGVSRFPMEFQQAQTFTTKGMAGVLVGDSAATPHPSTAKGLNTGVDEIGSIRDLVEDLKIGTGTDEERKQAMQLYEWEVKRRTDVMVNEAMEALQAGGRTRCTNLARAIWQLFKDKGADFNEVKTKIKDHVDAMSVAKDSEEAKGDRDWKLREAAVKNIRAFEGRLRTAITQMENLLRTNGAADLQTLMTPFNNLVA